MLAAHRLKITALDWLVLNHGWFGLPGTFDSDALVVSLGERHWASSGERPGMPPDALRCSGSPTVKNRLAPGGHSAKAEKPWSMHKETLPNTKDMASLLQEEVISTNHILLAIQCHLPSMSCVLIQFYELSAHINTMHFFL